jgi:microsomal dipeptidase-like Zn-dependent dipeptidase
MGPSPEDVRAIADMGGVVGLMMIHHAYGGASDPVDAFLNAVDYLIKNGGDGVVAIGSDFDGYPVTPKGLASPRDFSAVRKALLSRYTEEQTAKFLYGNAERLLSMGWGKA